MNNEEKILSILEQLQQGQADTNARLDKVDARLDKIDERLDKVEAGLDKVDARLDKVEHRLTRLETRVGDIELGQVRLEAKVDEGLKFAKTNVNYLARDHENLERRFVEHVQAPMHRFNIKLVSVRCAVTCMMAEYLTLIQFPGRLRN